MSIVDYRGFAGVRLEADVIGASEDPSVLLVHGAGQTRRVWDSVADALQQAGRRVISLDLRGHGGGGVGVDQADVHGVFRGGCASDRYCPLSVRCGDGGRPR